MEIYQRMKALSITPTEAAFSAVIRCCCQTNHLAEALHLYEDMKNCSTAVVDSPISAVILLYLLPSHTRVI